MKNPKALWLAKHWGLGIGILMGTGGLLMAAPGNMVTWKISQHTDSVFGEKIVSTAATRLGEKLPDGFKTVAFLPESHELKGLGISAMILGSSLMLQSSVALKKEYERLEKANWMIKQSEFQLSDLEFNQNVEVDRWVIELEAQQQISNMLQPPTSYYQKEDEQPKLKEPKFSRTATGFLAWLQGKAIERDSNDFEVRWCGMQSFNNEKVPKEQITAWVEELIQIEQAEWLDEKKQNFRWLND